MELLSSIIFVSVWLPTKSVKNCECRCFQSEIFVRTTCSCKFNTLSQNGMMCWQLSITRSESSGDFAVFLSIPLICGMNWKHTIFPDFDCAIAQENCKHFISISRCVIQHFSFSLNGWSVRVSRIANSSISWVAQTTTNAHAQNWWHR